MANPFRYSMKGGEAQKSVTCVCKLWFGKKYFIRKFKALHQGVDVIARDIDRRLRLGQKPEDIYDLVIKYIKRSRCSQFEVEVLFKSDKAQEVLLQEYKLLQESKTDADCLNTAFEVEYPKWVPLIDKEAFLSIKDGLQVGQVVTPARGVGGFRIKTLKTQDAAPAAEGS